MTSLEMQYDFDSKIRAHGKLSDTAIASTDTELFLRAAEESLIRKHAALFDKNAESRKYLNILIQTTIYNNTEIFTNTTNLTNGVYLKLPATVKYTLLERIGITNGTTNFDSRVEEITSEYYNLNYNNPFKNPYKDMCWRMVYGVDNVGDKNMIHQLILPSNFTFQYYKLTYICYHIPVNITTNTTSQLDSTIHPELVRLAVDLAIESFRITEKISAKSA